MDLLEAQRMLYILIVILIFSFETRTFGQNTFFNSKVDFFQEQEINKKDDSIQTPIDKGEGPELCTTCSSSPKVFNSSQFDDAKINGKIQIKLFVNPECQFSDGSIKILKDTLKNNSDISGMIYVISGFKGFKEFALNHKDIAEANIDITLDTEGLYKKEYEIKESPAFIIEKQGQIYRVQGQPDLEDILKNKL